MLRHAYSALDVNIIINITDTTEVYFGLKRLVHPRIKILSLITHPRIVPIQTRKTLIHLRKTNHEI